MKYKLIIFDLDGTLIDTSTGIINSVKYAIKELGLLTNINYNEFLGPPPFNVYKKVFNCSDELCFKATKLHRYYGKTKGYLESSIYPGIVELLTKLKKKKIKLAVATLKSVEIALAVLDHFGIRHFFDCVFGMNVAETYIKKDLIIKCMKFCKTSNYETVLVGDSESDLLGAINSGIDFLGVSYGYGYKQLIERNAKICDSILSLFDSLVEK